MIYVILKFYGILTLPNSKKGIQNSFPHSFAVSEFVGYLKGKSALMIFDKHPELGSKWDRSFWARGYYAATVGNITEEAIKNYICEQQEERKRKKLKNKSLF